MYMRGEAGGVPGPEKASWCGGNAGDVPCRGKVAWKGGGVDCLGNASWGEKAKRSCWAVIGGVFCLVSWNEAMGGVLC